MQSYTGPGHIRSNILCYETTSQVTRNRGEGVCGGQALTARAGFGESLKSGVALTHLLALTSFFHSLGLGHRTEHFFCPDFKVR